MRRRTRAGPRIRECKRPGRRAPLGARPLEAANNGTRDYCGPTRLQCIGAGRPASNVRRRRTANCGLMRAGSVCAPGVWPRRGCVCGGAVSAPGPPYASGPSIYTGPSCRARARELFEAGNRSAATADNDLRAVSALAAGPTLCKRAQYLHWAQLPGPGPETLRRGKGRCYSRESRRQRRAQAANSAAVVENRNARVVSSEERCGSVSSRSSAMLAAPAAVTRQ